MRVCAVAGINNLRERRNEIIRVVDTAWKAAAAATGVKGPFLDLEIAAASGEDAPPPQSASRAPWARLRVQHTASQSTAISGRKYRNEGSITVNVFTFRNTSAAWNDCQLIGDFLKLAIRKHRGNVQFYDVTMRERPVNNGFSQVDVVASFYWFETQGINNA